MGAPIHYQADKVREMCAAGATASEIAAAIGATAAGVKTYAKRWGLNLAPAPRGPAFTEHARQRAEEMAAMYRQGLTLQVIGDNFGLSRERVRKLLARVGVTPTEGGSRRVAQAKKDSRRAELDARCMLRYGVDRETRQMLQDCGALGAYRTQRQTARTRGIPFSLSLAEWWAVWQASGKYHLRGRGLGHYCMSRLNDQGGYEMGNIHIKLCEDNSREGLTRNKRGTKEFPGVFLIYPGRDRAWAAKYGKQNIGFYCTAQEAYAARVAYMEANGLRASVSALVGRGRGWSFMARHKTRPYRMRGPGGVMSYHATPEEAEAAYRAACEAYIAKKPTTADKPQPVEAV